MRNFMSDKLTKHILATIMYYDCFNYPLTAFETWKYLIKTDYCSDNNQSAQASLAEITKKLRDDNLAQYVESFNGFYFLKGRKYLVERRMEGNKISAGKLKKILKIAWWLRMGPFVRMIGMTGALAMKNATVKSDLDLFIVLKKGKIWTGRTLVTFFVHMIGKRRYGAKIADRACLNFFVTDQSLEIITKDLFSANEYMFLFPLYGEDVFQRFQIRNQWIRTMKPSYALCEILPLKILADSFVSKKIRNMGEIILAAEWIENLLRKIEKKRIMQNPKTRQEGSMVYANDDALIFLPDPHGPKIFEQFKKKVAELSI